MPCFKGLAVSIHTPTGPLPEYSVQRQTRLGRITTYIPVPPPKIPSSDSTDEPEQSTFAISITLLTPGLAVPYSAPKPTADNPFPKPKRVGGLSGGTGDRGKYPGSVAPYPPLTTSINETIAAYIYFDGRQKEEVATLLRRGEETWVNSRWVSVPESEGGGLAEREFLFREVGLEQWLNGLDLEGKDAAATIERRRQKLEKKHRHKKEKKREGHHDVEMSERENESKTILRYGGDALSPVEDVPQCSSSSSDSDDDPIPESAGQIKVALFRVLASGDIKRGEYSPQFDAHDDDDDDSKDGTSGTADIDHTTSFAKPKALDPKSISTQTVTGIDPSDKPYAVFTFLYRGERQLQKMGILPSSRTADKTTPNAKRKSLEMEFQNLKPLKSEGTIGFSTFRDPSAHHHKHARVSSIGDNTKMSDDSDMDSDDDDSGDRKSIKIEEPSDKDDAIELSADDRQGGELAEGVRKIQLKRQRSADPLLSPTDPLPAKAPKSSPSHTPTTTALATPPALQLPSSDFALDTITQKSVDSAIIGSPFKKARASLGDSATNARALNLDSNNISLNGIATSMTAGSPPTLAPISSILSSPSEVLMKKEDEDEEL